MPDASLVDRFRAQLIGYLPTGAAFAKTPGSVTYRLLDGCATELARVKERISILVDEELPSNAVENLSAWEEALGLPDPLVPATTIEDRQAQVAARLLDRLGHTDVDIATVAARFDFELVSVTRFEPATCASSCNAALTNEFWAHAITLRLKGFGDPDAVRAAVLRLRRSHAYFFFDVLTLDQLLVDGDEPLLVDDDESLLIGA